MKPPIVRSTVVFPHPEGPSSVTNSPSRMSRLKLLSTYSPSNETAMSLREIMVFSNSDASPLRRRGGPRQNLVACLMLFTHNPALLMNDCLPQRMRTNFFPYTEKGHPQIRARPAYRMKTAAKKQGRFYTGPLLPPGADLLFQMQTQ